MKIAILGAGNAGCAVAADLTMKGHIVTLVKTSNSMHNDNFYYMRENDNEVTLWENGKERRTKIHKLTRDISDIAGNEVIIIYIQTNFHEELIRQMARYL